MSNRFQIADHVFGIRKATVSIAISDRADAARMRVPHARLDVEVEGVPADMPGAPSSTSYFSPKVYIEYPLALADLGIRSCANLSFSRDARAALYTYKHQTLAESHINLVDTDCDLHLEWTGKSSIAGRVVPVHIVAKPQFEGIVVYADDAARARAMANAEFPLEDLDQVETKILDPGRKKYALFGPVVGRTGYVRFAPKSRAVVAPWMQ